MTFFLRGGLTLADPTHLAELLKGVESWNAWREANLEIEEPDLSGVDFTANEYKDTPLYIKDDKGNPVINLRDANLQGAILNFTNLQRATLVSANLKTAKLGEANLKHACLMMTNLHGAYLQKAKLQYANLILADLEWALLMEASLTGARVISANLLSANFSSANLYGANLARSYLHGANLRGATLEGANVTGVKFSRDSCQLNFQGIRVSTCYGNQIFKSFAQDQDYIETLRASGRWGAFKFWIWYILSDCGRSFGVWGCWALGFATLFGYLFYWMGPHHFQVDHLPFELSTMIYYSVVTFTTLGFGDVKPATIEASALVMVEVLLGYVMLGGLISIMANKLARRS